MSVGDGVNHGRIIGCGDTEDGSRDPRSLSPTGYHVPFPLESRGRDGRYLLPRPRPDVTPDTALGPVVVVFSKPTVLPHQPTPVFRGAPQSSPKRLVSVCARPKRVSQPLDFVRRDP